jgi:glycosyltransferase involved in cell wall biosynthesis
MEINVLTPFHRGGPYKWGQDLADLLNRKGVTAKHMHEYYELFSTPFYQKADIVHTAVPLAYRLWQKPVVLTIHGEYTIEKMIWRLPYHLAIKKADIITTPSRFLKERLGLDEAEVIPNSVFIEKYKPVTHSHKKTLNLITISNFAFKDKANGILGILKILNEVSARIDEKIDYTIVGGGSYLDQIKNESKKYSNFKITFTGFQNNPEVLLEKKDVFLYYSVHDNFPISILEAMASGLPVVGNNVGALHEMIKTGVNGFVAENSMDYRDYLISLITEHRNRAKVGLEARRTVEERFDWSCTIERYISLYNDLISRNGA